MKEDMKQDEKELLRAEIAIMRLVNHPNIIRMEAVYESKKARNKHSIDTKGRTGSIFGLPQVQEQNIERELSSEP